MSTFYTTFLSKSDFSFALLLVTFEPLDIQQSYIPLLKALMCGINAVGAQGSGCMFTLCHAPLKMAVLLHKTEKVWDSFSETVCNNIGTTVLIVFDQNLLQLLIFCMNLTCVGKYFVCTYIRVSRKCQDCVRKKT